MWSCRYIIFMSTSHRLRYSVDDFIVHWSQSCNLTMNNQFVGGTNLCFSFRREVGHYDEYPFNFKVHTRAYSIREHYLYIKSVYNSKPYENKDGDR